MEKYKMILSLIESYGKLVDDWNLNEERFFIRIELSGSENFHSFSKEFKIKENSIEEMKKILDEEIKKAEKHLF